MWQEIDRHITVNITKAFATSFSQSIFIPKCSNSVLSQSHSPPLALNNGITLHYRAIQSIQITTLRVAHHKNEQIDKVLTEFSLRTNAIIAVVSTSPRKSIIHGKVATPHGTRRGCIVRNSLARTLCQSKLCTNSA